MASDPPRDETGPRGIGKSGLPAPRPDDVRRTIRTLLASDRPEDLRRGLALVEMEIARVGSSEARSLFEMVSAIFYLDPLDRPDLVPVLDEAVSLVVGFGAWVIPVLLDHLEAGDLKAQLAAGNALGRIGADAVEPLLARYASTADPATRVFILYALGKIASPRVVRTVPVALEASRSESLELRDTATRAIGKLAESIPPPDLPTHLKLQLLDRLHASLADTNPGIRAKAVRSLGKLAKAGHLDAAQKQTLATACRRLLGEDESFEWDRAFVVRKEAQEALRFCGA